MKIKREFLDWDIKHLYFLFILSGVLADVLMNGGFHVGLYLDGYRQILTEALVFGLIFTALVDMPAKLRKREEAWDAIYDFKDGLDSYSQGRIRSAFRDLLSVGVKTFTFYAPKGGKRDFSNMRISTRKIIDSSFIEVTFTRAKWWSLTFKNCKFKNVSFLAAIFNRVKFIDCHFIGCDFSRVKGKKIKVIDCEFTNCKGEIPV